METTLSFMFLDSINPVVRMKVFPERDGNRTAVRPSDKLDLTKVRMKVFPERDGNYSTLAKMNLNRIVCPNEGLP